MGKKSKKGIIEYCTDTQPIQRYERTPEGYLRLWISVAVADKDLEYVSDGKKRIEYIDRDSLFDKESLTTAMGKPFSVDHPPEPIFSTNYKKYSVGTTLQEFIDDEGRLVVSSLITDPEIVDAIEKKKIKYTSSAYSARKIPQSDNRIRQTKRKYNHFGLLTEYSIPRAGTDSTIIYDSKPSTQIITMPQAENSTQSEAPTTAQTTPNTQSTIDDVLMAVKGLVTLLSTQNTPSAVTTDSANDKRSLPTTETKTETTPASDKPTNQDSTSDLVKLWSEYKQVIETANKTVDYNLDGVAVKKLILGCYYPDTVINQLDSKEKLEGFWMNFEANKDSIKTQDGKLFSTTNNDAKDPRLAFTVATSRKAKTA